MLHPNRPIALAVLGLATLALSGCEKPYPGVTVWSGTHSDHAQALCWQPNVLGVLGDTECAQEALAKAASGAGVSRIMVAPGNTVGISVDPVAAAKGWSIKVGGQDFVTGLTGTYYRFTFPAQVPATETGFSMQITANGVGGGARGYWFFQLIPS